ncbi:hypothetical protein KKA03_02435 [archaeon]|nr:hypothetical protein [archaeon]
MKKIFLLLTLLLVPQVSAAGADFYVIDIAPTEVAPGETTTLNMTLKNLGNNFGIKIRSTLDPSDTSPIDALDSSKKSLGRAEAAQRSDEYFGVVRQLESIPVKYRIKVDDNATTGSYNVPLSLVWENEFGVELSQTLYLGIAVVGEPNLIISGINSTPERVYPDTEFSLDVTIENTGTEKAKAVEAALKLPDGITGENLAYLGTINRDMTTKASYTLKATKAVKSSAYDFVLSIDYEDKHGTPGKVERPFTVFISERGDVDLEIAGISTSPAKLYPGTDFTLSVQLENIGTQDAKSVMASVSNREGFVGEFSSFVGKIESDDVSSGIFDLTATPMAAPGDHTFEMEIEFTDEKGEVFFETKTFNVYVDEPAKRSTTGTVAILLIVVIVGVVLWRRRKAQAEIVE